MAVRVSIITATYNRANFLSEVIESVLAQTFTAWELLVVDDGSTDATATIMHAWCLRDERIVYVRQPENKGVSAARNEGLRLARGEYIAVLDSDDVWIDPAKMYDQVALLDQNARIGVVAGGMQKKVGVRLLEREYLPPADDAGIRRFLLRSNPLYHSSVMYRRSAVHDSGGYSLELSFGEDYDLWLRLGKKWLFAALPRVVVVYRIHESSVTSLSGIRAAILTAQLVWKYRKEYPSAWSALVVAGVRILYSIVSYGMKNMVRWWAK